MTAASWLQCECFVCMFVCVSVFSSICSYCLHTPLRYLCWRLLYFCRMNVCTVQGAALCEMLYFYIFFKLLLFFFFLTSCLGKRLKAASCASPWRAVLLNHSIGPLNTAFKPFNPTQHILRSCAQHFNSQFYLCLWVTTPINDTHAKYPAPCVYI